ncbi:hypothetical protein EUX98_g7436 [Antrodiella citrinella]|uniref:Enoyl reductase (ER) domain-containing protein n=1 Tax=Antrodiella citrinella TaxID=2447956 RepID=A0A4S4MLT8_9APHY|nr:hypothetical protein EUX98_g7436 [Antrodiella citrinella]
MRALITVPGNTAAVQDKAVPEPGPHEIRIKVHSVALNPVDALYTSHPPAPPGRVVGSDIAGVVDKLGEGVLRWNVGDRVAGFLQGATCENERPGGFAEYAILEWDLAIAILKEVSFDEAATVPLCSLTAAQSLLIYSVTTSLGLFVLELSKLLRTPTDKCYRIFATASPKNHQKLLDLGVEKAFDYRDPDWPQRVKEASGGIHYAVDCISEGDSTAKISRTYNNGGGVIACIRKSTWDKEGIRDGVVGLYSSVWIGLGKDIRYNGPLLCCAFGSHQLIVLPLGELMPPDPTWRDFSVSYYNWLSNAGVAKKFSIPPNPVRLMPGGIERIVPDGFTLLGSN